MTSEGSLKQEIKALQFKIESYESEIQKLATLNHKLSIELLQLSHPQAELEKAEGYKQELEKANSDLKKQHLYRVIQNLNQEHDCLTQIIQDSENAIDRTIAVVKQWQKEQQPEHDHLIIPIQIKILEDLQRLVKLKAQLCSVDSDWVQANNQFLILD